MMILKSLQSKWKIDSMIADRIFEMIKAFWGKRSVKGGALYTVAIGDRLTAPVNKMSQTLFEAQLEIDEFLEAREIRSDLSEKIKNKKFSLTDKIILDMTKNYPKLKIKRFEEISSDIKECVWLLNTADNGKEFNKIKYMKSVKKLKNLIWLFTEEVWKMLKQIEKVKQKV